MKQQIIFWIIVLLVISSGLVFCANQPERIDTGAFDAPQRPGAVFDHDAHNEKAGLEDDCSICHHVYENNKIVPDESSEDQACSECHRIRPNAQNRICLTKAFHQRCKECHMDLGKGPVLCGQCHIKKSGLPG